MILQFFMVGLGSALGGCLRYGLSLLFPAFGMGTLIVNLGGCLLMGLLIGYAQTRGLGDLWMLLLGVGLLGGFTTFSAFAPDSVNALQDNLLNGISYIGLHLIGSLFLFVIGRYGMMTWLGN